MKGKIFSTVILCASLFSLSAAAQPATDSIAPQEQPAQRGMLLFDGTNLTPEQQTRIAEFKKARAEKQNIRKAQRDSLRKERARAMRQNRDSIRKANQREYLDGIKAILTPEQYVIFLENAYMARKQQPAPKQGGMGVPPKPRRDGMGPKDAPCGPEGCPEGMAPQGCPAGGPEGVAPQGCPAGGPEGVAPQGRGGAPERMAPPAPGKKPAGKCCKDGKKCDKCKKAEKAAKKAKKKAKKSEKDD
jgi:Spy/CpxP family protein refolding chaperone